MIKLVRLPFTLGDKDGRSCHNVYSGASLSRTPLGEFISVLYKKGVLYSGVYKVLISLTWDIDRSVL